MKIKFFISFLFFLTFKLYDAKPQSLILIGDKTIGGNDRDKNASIAKNSNNKIIISGMSRSNFSGDKSDPLCDSTSIQPDDIWVVKTNPSLNEIWNIDLGGKNNESLKGQASIVRNNKSIFTALSSSDSSCDKSENNRNQTLINGDYWICMVDSNGLKIWDRTLGGNGNEAEPKIIQLTTTDLIIGGVSNSPVSGDKTVMNFGPGTDYWLVKLDSSGNKIWDKVYGGSGAENAYGFSLLADANGAFILAGSTDSPVSGNITQASHGATDIWIIKLDSAGNSIWDKRYGGSLAEQCNHISKTKDNGYILCGTTVSPQGGDITDSSRGGTDWWVVKLDSLGNKQWDKRYGGNDDDEATWIEESPDAGYYIAGNTQSDSSFDISEHPFGQYHDYWFIVTDSLGNKLTDRRFGGPGNNECTNFIQMPDSTIYLSGSADSGTTAVKSDPGKGDSDYWLLHLKYTDQVLSTSHPTAEDVFTIAPNPSAEILQLNFNNTQNRTIKISNLLGEEVLIMQTKDKSLRLDVDNLIAGVYFITSQTKNSTVTKKFIKE